MIPLVDMHCHLLAGLDDGPQTDEEALAMCRLSIQEGVGMVAATAHQNSHYPEVTPQRIREATQKLNSQLKQAGLSLNVFPTAEIIVFPGMELAWQEQKLLSMADRGAYLLVEMPHGLFVDLHYTAREFRSRGIRLILAHPERYPEFLHDPGRIEALIEDGCLVQVSSASVTSPGPVRNQRALKDWFQRGVVHFLGSDGHSPTKRAPLMLAAYEQIERWTDPATADRICSTNGLAVFQGLPLRTPPPLQPARRWYSWIWR